MKRIFRALNFDDRQSAVLMSAMNGDNTGSITNTILNSMTREGDAVFSEAIDLALLLDLYEQIDKYVTVAQTETGYTASVQITNEQLGDILGAVLGMSLDDATRDVLSANLTFSANASVVYDGEKQTSEVSLTMPNKTITLTETATADSFTPPETAYDITEAFLNVL